MASALVHMKSTIFEIVSRTMNYTQTLPLGMRAQKTGSRSEMSLPIHLTLMSLLQEKCFKRKKNVPLN